MDAAALGVNMKIKSKRQFKRRSKKEIKVVYISTPMRVKTSVSKFRAIVQELTGKDSDTTRFVDVNDYVAQNCSKVLDQKGLFDDDDHEPTVPLANNSYQESSPSPDSSVFEPFAEVPDLPSVDESFMGWFETNFLFQDSPHVGVIN